MDGLFKYIRKVNGKYVIRNNCVWGTYDKVEDALHDRDLLVACDWDISEVLARDEIPNKYYEMDIPSYESYIGFKEEMKYITTQKIDGKEYYTVQRRHNRILRRYGYYKTLEEAIDKRNELMENDWYELGQ